jgi:hypothetical protein
VANNELIMSAEPPKPQEQPPPSADATKFGVVEDVATPDTMPDSAPDTLNLDTLEDEKRTGMPGISKRRGGSFKEAAITCLEENGHAPGVSIEVDGDSNLSIKVIWTIEGNADQRLDSWRDRSEAAEHGAYGIAALLIDLLTEYTVIDRSKKGTGFDYWLGKKGMNAPLFQDKARMEVSGILKGNESDIKGRVRQKENQIAPSDGSLPGIIAVVEFSAPRARMRTKK